jgi:translation initiation factor IF-2
LNGACTAEDKFSVESEKEAKNIAAEREQLLRQQFFKTQNAPVEEDPNVQVLNLMIKGDVYGSIQALSDSLLKLQNDVVKINIISTNVGIVNDSDVNFAVTAKASIICFNVKPSPSASRLAAQNKVNIKTFSLIYDAIEDLEEVVKNMSIDKEKRVVKGRAEVKELFKITKVGMIAGCFILEGSMTTKSKVQIVRDGNVVFNSEITQIKHYKSDIKEAKVNTECGIYIRNYNDYQVGDILECYVFAYEMTK